jgi:hypothetical protein
MKVHSIVRVINLLYSTGSSTPTDFALAQKVVGSLNVNWDDPTNTFLDPACGRGSFLLALCEKLEEHGHSIKHIVTNMLYGCDIDKVQTMIARKALYMASGIEPNIYCDDSLTRNWDMTVKYIVGNPPYQRNDNKAKRWTLWEEFVKKSLELADTVALVVPQSVTSPNASFNLIKDKCSVLNIDVSKHFNVGSTFCYFVAHKNQKITDTKIITDSTEFTKDISQVPFLPSVISNETLSQLDDLLARPKKTWRRGELHTSNQHIFSLSGKYSVMHTNAQELKTDIEHENKTKIRVAVSLSGYPTFRVIQNQYVTQACFWTEFKTLADAKKFAKECNSDKIQNIMKVFKWSGWNSKEVIQCL